MTSYVETKIVCLTSQSASIKKNSSYLSDVRYNLGTILKSSPDVIHRQVQLLNAQLPYSFYVINYTNQVLKMTFTVGGTFTVNIPVGNYNATYLIAAIKTAIGLTGLNIAISPINGKLTFTYTSDFSIDNTVTHSIGSVLGFGSGVTSSSGNTLVAPNPLNLLGIKTLQIRSINLIMNNISSVQGGQTILLANIPVSCVPFGMIDYVDRGNLMSISNTDLDDLDIEIVDGESGEYINFNGQDWCLTLAFHTTRLLETSLANPFYEIPRNIPTSEAVVQKPKTKNEKDLELLQRN